MRLKRTKMLPLIALTFIAGAIFFAASVALNPLSAYAAAESAQDAPAPPASTVGETLTVDEVWLTGDTLHIAVTDKTSSEKQTLELKLSDYAKSGDEYVSVQATDTSGRTSNVIQFKNPYYVATEGQSSETTESPAPSGEASESAIPNGDKAFTPDGAGSVVDNATDKDGKEFFTVKTADGNEFYLIVDRQRNAENVYLLNAVTEDDLKSLAKSGDGKSESAIPTPSAPLVTEKPEATAEPTPAPASAKSGGNNSAIILIVIAALAVGGAGYYFKIVRPKKSAIDDPYEDEADDDEGVSYESEDDERGVDER